MQRFFMGDSVIARADGFAAGGTLPRSSPRAWPNPKRRIWLLVELGVLFIAAPLVMHVAVRDFNVPLFYALPPVLGMMLFLLFLDPTFHLDRELRRPVSLGTLRSILAIFAIGSVLVTMAVALAFSEKLFALAAERPGKWAKIMVLYPFTSVLAQEFAYRVFFFHRYGPLFPNRAALIVANALAFGFAHILFRNWIAVGGTLVWGLLFAWRYERTRSFWAVWLEHVLWGWLVFTVGLGVFFFTGVANPAW